MPVQWFAYPEVGQALKRSLNLSLCQPCLRELGPRQRLSQTSPGQHCRLSIFYKLFVVSVFATTYLPSQYLLQIICSNSWVTSTNSEEYETSMFVKFYLLEIILNQLVPSTPAFYIIMLHILTIAAGRALTLTAPHLQNEFQLPLLVVF